MSGVDLLDPGRHAFYVFGAYAVTGLLMLAEPLLAIRRRRRALAALDDPDRADS